MPRSRAYVHAACGRVTGIDGEHFVGLTNPLKLCGGTYCSHCEKMAPLKDVAWSDTGETLLDYRRRLRREKVPAALTVGGELVAPIVLAILVAAVAAWGSRNTNQQVLVALFCGASAGIAAWLLLPDFLNRRFYKIDFRRFR